MCPRAVSGRVSGLDKPVLFVEDTSLDEWLALVNTIPEEREYFFNDWSFPTDRHKKEYLATIAERSDYEIKELLRHFLMIGGGLECDRTTLDFLFASGRIREAVEEVEHVKRLLNPARHPWEGNTWVLDLLPLWPQMAIDAIRAYIAAHCQFLPDGRWDGLSDAIDIIRARYLEAEHPQEVLLRLRARDFEYLIAYLYQQMGYSVEITPPARDGGYDILAESTESGRAERILIECKRYLPPVRVEAVRALKGILTEFRATKGILVTTSDFTRPARRQAAASGRIDLVNFAALNRLMNQYIGADWPRFVDLHIAQMQREISNRKTVLSA